MYHFRVQAVWKDKDQNEFLWRMTVTKGDQVFYFEHFDTFEAADAAVRLAQQRLAKDARIEYLQLTPEMFQGH